MKNRHVEQTLRAARQYHRNHPWRMKGGLCTPFAHLEPDALTWRDDVGFVLNGRRVMVWFSHPRMKYSDAISDLAWTDMGEAPQDIGSMFEDSGKNWKKVGRSRKKVVLYTMKPFSVELSAYYDEKRNNDLRIQAEGIDLVVRPSIEVKTLSWCTGVSLCVPVEVRQETDLVALAALAKRLIKHEVTLDQLYPGYEYGREDWLGEAGLRNQDKPQT